MSIIAKVFEKFENFFNIHSSYHVRLVTCTFKKKKQLYAFKMFKVIIIYLFKHFMDTQIK